MKINQGSLPQNGKKHIKAYKEEERTILKIKSKNNHPVYYPLKHQKIMVAVNHSYEGTD